MWSRSVKLAILDACERVLPALCVPVVLAHPSVYRSRQRIQIIRVEVAAVAVEEHHYPAFGNRPMMLFVDVPVLRHPVRFALLVGMNTIYGLVRDLHRDISVQV